MSGGRHAGGPRLRRWWQPVSCGHMLGCSQIALCPPWFGRLGKLAFVPVEAFKVDRIMSVVVEQVSAKVDKLVRFFSFLALGNC